MLRAFFDIFASLRALGSHLVAKMWQDSAKTAQDAPTWPKIAPGRAKRAPRRAKKAPKRPHIAPPTPPKTSKSDGGLFVFRLSLFFQRSHPRCLKCRQKGPPKGVKLAIFSLNLAILAPSWRQLGPSWRLLGPSWLHFGLPGAVQNWPKSLPRPTWSQHGPKPPPRPPKPLPRPLLTSIFPVFCCFF